MSKGLEAFQRIKNTPTYDNGLVKDFHPSCCEIVEKELKALEIIKRDLVMVACEFYRYVVEEHATWEEYCQVFPEEERHIKNKEEYELLREVLL